MKVKVLSKTKTEVGSKDLPDQFFEPIRPDLIKRAVLTLQANRRQAYGAMPKAGMRHSADLSRRRRKYRGSYGFGISRVPRKILSRRGTRFNWAGAIMPGTVGGRRAHPPKAEKIWSRKLNVKENRKAIRSALAATMVKELVEQRGHKVPSDYPFVVQADIENVVKTSDLLKNLEKLGFGDELERTSEPRKRAGRGKLRGRTKIEKKGLLLVVSNKDAPIIKAADNIQGVEAVVVNSLNAELLAPGTDIGRVTLYTDKAIDALATGLFMKDYKAPKVEKHIEAKVTKK